MAMDFLTVKAFPAREIALMQPPSRTRLEPQSFAGDPRPGIEARVHDPLWLLGRQWQLGEYVGEDAGTPLSVRVVTRTSPVDRWATVDKAGVVGPSRPFVSGLLEPAVEDEPAAAESLGPGLRARAEAGAAFLAALDDAVAELDAAAAGAVAAVRAAVLVSAPLDVDPAHHPDGARAGLDRTWLRLERLLAGRVVDGERLAVAVEAAGGLPGFLVPAVPAARVAVEAVVDSWLGWYRAEVSPVSAPGGAWVGERLEYRFRVGTGPAGAGQVVLDAPAHGGGDVDWHTFDASAGAVLADPAGAVVPDVAKPVVHAVMATPLRYPGMPADRLWEMEDAQVNLGLVEAEPWDLARLLVAEFALTYGNDWLVVPVDVPYGSLTLVDSVVYTTTFGERFVVRPTDEVSPDGAWRMFTLTTGDGAGVDGLVVPPGAVSVEEGQALEEVLFLRDEMANLVWAVEKSVQGPSGLARDRSRELDDPRPQAAGPVPTAALDYLLATSVPARWIPYLPRSSGYRSISLVQGAMPGEGGTAVRPIGRLLLDGDMSVLKDAEVPREGVRVRRVPAVTRSSDGRFACWTTRRVTVGRGEGASNLAFDATTERR